MLNGIWLTLFLEISVLETVVHGFHEMVKATDDLCKKCEACIRHGVGVDIRHWTALKTAAFNGSGKREWRVRAS